MVSAKKKIEVLFKAAFNIENPSEATTKKYLTEVIAGLKIKKLEFYPAKGKVLDKAVISSNVGELLAGSSVSTDAEIDAYHRGKSQSFMGVLPGFNAGADIIGSGADDKEISELGMQLSKARKEIVDLKAQLEAKNKQASIEELTTVFQGQIMTLTQDVEKLDNEKTKLEKSNKTLNDKIEELQQQLDLRAEIRQMSSSKGGMSPSKGAAKQEISAREQLDSMETLVMKARKEIEEERVQTQEKLNQMTLKIIAEQEKTENIIKDAKLAVELKKRIPILEKEKDDITSALQSKEEQLTQLQVQYNEGLAKIKSLKDSLSISESAKADTEKKLNESIANAESLERKRGELESENQTLKKDKETQAKKLTDVEAERTALIAERDKILGEFSQVKQKLAQAESGREPFKQEIAEKQKTIKEQAEEIRTLKTELSAKEYSIKEAKAELATSEKQNESLQKKLTESESNLDSKTKQLQKLEKSGKSSEKIQSSTKQKIEALELDLKKKDKELKTKSDQFEQTQREMIGIKAKLDSSEKNSFKMNEELNDLRRKSGSSTTTADQPMLSTGSSHSDYPHKGDSSDSQGQISKLKVELDNEKNKNAELNGKFFEKKDAYEKEKARADQYETEIKELKLKAEQFASIGKTLEQYESLKKEVAELQKENNRLKDLSQEGAEAITQSAILQKQHEDIVKEKNELKERLFELEQKHENKSMSEKEAQEKKLSIIEEIRQILSEVVYVYKTLDTNAKEFLSTYEEKKGKLNSILPLAHAVESSGKKDEQLSLLKKLSEVFYFIQAIPLKPENLKILLPCLSTEVGMKARKSEIYEDQINKFKTMLSVSQTKMTEYEGKLATYY